MEKEVALPLIPGHGLVLGMGFEKAKAHLWPPPTYLNYA